MALACVTHMGDYRSIPTPPIPASLPSEPSILCGVQPLLEDHELREGDPI